MGLMDQVKAKADSMFQKVTAGTRMYESGVLPLFYRRFEDRSGRIFLNVGLHKHQWSALYPLFRRVVCFEPNPEFQNVPTVLGTEIDLYPYALSDKEGYALLNIRRGPHSGHSTLLPAHPLYPKVPIGSQVPVRTVRLDAFGALNLGPDCLVKIDTEGTGAEVVRGGPSMLKECNLCIELHSAEETQEIVRTLGPLARIDSPGGWGYFVRHAWKE
jgi:FkbM family methyltransferase